jgi:asparagine synthase (glutamine-hydrolysing)
MTDFLSYRGPDGIQIWAEGHAGLGHALLRIASERSNESYPAHGGHLAITADARLDSRVELVHKLEAAGHTVERATPDSALILHAYTAWGPRCVEHLRGDFSFGIWDSRAKTLFCARDHFGIKPFYYAALGNLFLFSNTLNCLREHPAVTNELNEFAIGDFLLCGLNYNKATTTFRDIQRLPPAHWLLVSRDTLQIKCYWSPPGTERIQYPRGQDYVDRFNDILKAAVLDRLPADRVGILLSGGLDSGSVAVASKELSDGCGGAPALYSYTVGYDSLIPDDEGAQASALAKFLGISNRYLALDQVELFDKWDDPYCRFPEPVDSPLSAGMFDQFRAIAADCRVVFSGEGADNLMYFQMWPYVADLRRNQQWRRMVVETAEFLWVRPFPWLGLARRARSLFSRVSGGGGLPSWIKPDFAKRTGLHERWRDRSALEIPPQRHLARPKAQASMLLPHWAATFEIEDPGVTRQAVEVRYPLLDLRIVDYLLAVPAFPWLYKKKLLRQAMMGRLPENVRLRQKTPLAADPVARKLVNGGGGRIIQRRLDGKISEYVREPVVEDGYINISVDQLRPYCLDLWMRYCW